jgi:TolA-binding protein
LDRYTRHELKQDELQQVLDAVQNFGRKYHQQIIFVGAALIVMAGLAFGLKTYASRKEAAANAALQEALTTFDAYVGQAPSNSLGSSAETFPTAEAKYKKALDEFQAVTKKYPRTKAGAYARIHAGICQAQLGNSAAAIKTFNEAARSSDHEVASLARFSLAQELAREGKTDEAAKMEQALADHPTLNVPKATALMALASLYRAKQPARARQIYQQLQKEFGSSDPILTSAIKQQMGNLPE